MTKPLPSFFLEFTQHTCGFFLPSSEQLHHFPSGHKILSSSVSPLTLRYLCSLFSSCPLLKLLPITCVHAHTYIYVRAHQCPLSCRVQSQDSWNGFFWLTCIHRSSVSFIPSLDRLIFFRFLLTRHFLYEDFSDLLHTALTALPAVWGQGFFVCFSPCCISCTHSHVWWTVGTE